MRILILIIFLAFSVYLFADLLINELMVDPEASDNGKEWIELYNNSAQTLNLNGWKIQSAGTSFSTNYTFPEMILLPFSFILIGESEVPNCTIYTNLDFQNGGSASDGVRIVSPDNMFTDTIIYDTPNTNNLMDDIANPSLNLLIADFCGKSIARKIDGLDKNNITDWQTNDFVTPGYSNNNYIDVEISDIYILVTDNHLKINTLIHNLSTISVDLNTSYIEYLIDSLSYNLDPLMNFNSQNFCFLSTETGDLSTGIHKLSVNVFVPGDLNTVNNNKSLFFVIGQNPLLINEVMYSPLSNHSEWLELYNQSTKEIFLQNAYIEDAAQGKINFNAHIPAGAYYLLCQNASSVLNDYPFVNQTQIIPSSSWTPLNNSGDILKLKYDESLTLDSMSYSINACPLGLSLERHSLGDSVYWSPSESEYGASPSLTNTQNSDLKDVFIGKTLINKNNDTLLHKLKIYAVNFDDSQMLGLKIYSKTNHAEYSLLFEDEFLLDNFLEYDFSSGFTPYVNNFYKYEIYCLEDENINNNISFCVYSDNTKNFVINEIMYNPLLNEPEWLEIRVNDAYPEFDTLFCSVGNDSMCFATNSSEYIILCHSKADSIFLKNKYGLNLCPVYYGMGNLLNNGVSLSLKDKYQNIAEQFTYKPIWSKNKGVSIERRSPFILPEDSNWGASRNYSSIGNTNTLFMQIDSLDAFFNIYPNKISPYRNEQIVFQINMQNPPLYGRIKIYDLKGRLIIEIKIANNQNIPINILWDGKDSNKKNILPGIYLAFLELKTPEGNIIRSTKKLYCGY